MGHQLLVYTLLFHVFSSVKGDFLVEGLRNLQKRNVAEPVNDIEVYSINIDSKVTSRFAHNVITSRVINRASVSQEATFKVDLPKTAFITSFSMIIDETTYSGVIKDKQAAKEYYEAAVSLGQTAGLVEASGRKTEKLTVSVNIAAQSEVTFELVYEEMLKRNQSKYEMLIKVQPQTLVTNFQIEVEIHEPQGISFLEAKATFITNDLQSVIQKSFSAEKGYVSFKPTLDQQRSCEYCTTTLLDGDFTVTYDVNRETPGNIQVVNGYFVHFFAPRKLPGVPKNVIYVIDKSGSMQGRKIQQTREALLEILKDTAEHDHFNFILFDDKIELWKPSLVKATPENLKEAKEFVRRINDGSATNINDPMLKAVKLLDEAHKLNQVPERSVSLIVLLTDGEANIGVTIPETIQENVRKAIEKRYTVYCLGFGYGVDYRFLEKMALENSGIARRIYEDSDAVLQMKGFYTEIANPTLLDIKLQYPENAIANLTQNSFKHYFDGSEIVVAGRIIDNDLNFLSVDVKAEGAEDVLNYHENIQLQDKDVVKKEQEYIFGDFTERLWAYLTIQQLLEKRVFADPSETEELQKEALDLSLKFKFVTPLTSMVVKKENGEETLVADKFVEGNYPGHMSPFPGNTGQVSPNWVDGDPHFLINVPNKNDALCFNIQEAPGVVLKIVEDQELGIAVNGEIIGKKSNNVTSKDTYFGKLGIVNRDMKLRIEVTTEKITIMMGTNKKEYTWEKKTSVKKEGFNLVIYKNNNITLSFGEGAKCVIILHHFLKDDPLNTNFLGFYTLDDHTFSKSVHGLLGQFFHGIDYEISNIHETKHPDRPNASMKVKNKLLNVTRSSQRDFKSDHKNGKKVPCWFVDSNAEGLIDGTHKDYIVPNIFSIA